MTVAPGAVGHGQVPVLGRVATSLRQSDLPRGGNGEGRGDGAGGGGGDPDVGEKVLLLKLQDIVPGTLPAQPDHQRIFILLPVAGQEQPALLPQHAGLLVLTLPREVPGRIPPGAQLLQTPPGRPCGSRGLQVAALLAALGHQPMAKRIPVMPEVIRHRQVLVCRSEGTGTGQAIRATQPCRSLAGGLGLFFRCR
ncbi:hypothetical protein G3I36_22380 [Streptomyces sp. SID10362]|nr:hypothetical protein [Streptomyces sp. SID10362]